MTQDHQDEQEIALLSDSIAGLKRERRRIDATIAALIARRMQLQIQLQARSMRLSGQMELPFMPEKTTQDGTQGGTLSFLTAKMRPWPEVLLAIMRDGVERTLAEIQELLRAKGVEPPRSNLATYLSRYKRKGVYVAGGRRGSWQIASHLVLKPERCAEQGCTEAATDAGYCRKHERTNPKEGKEVAMRAG